MNEEDRRRKRARGAHAVAGANLGVAKRGAAEVGLPGLARHRGGKEEEEEEEEEEEAI